MGLGAYDFAAARMFYGDAVAVHADPSYKATTPRGKGMLAKTDGFGGLLGIQPEYDDARTSITRELQNKYELIKPRGCVGEGRPERVQCPQGLERGAGRRLAPVARRPARHRSSGKYHAVQAAEGRLCHLARAWRRRRT